MKEAKMPNRPTVEAQRILWLMVVILLPYMAKAAEVDNYQARMQELLADSQYRQAAQVLGEAAAAADDDDTRQQLLLQQGDVYYYYLEDYRQALASYKVAYDVAPKTEAAANALYRRGLIYMDKLQNKDKAVKEFEVVLRDFPDYHKKDELKRLLKGTLSRAYKLELIQRKNYWKFFISLIDALIIFFWKVVHEYASVNKSRKVMVDVALTLLIILNVTIWWIVIHAEAQLDMLGLGIIR
jgi:tetratricopeptide (TPR) repeat protein